MLPNKKSLNPSKFNSMAQIQIKCVKLSKPITNNSKSNRSNSSLNITSPTQIKEKVDQTSLNNSSLKKKLNSININNTINSSAPKNYFLMPNHNTNSSANRSKTLHHSKMNLVNSHNDQLNDSNKENSYQKAFYATQNSMGNLTKINRDEYGSLNKINIKIKSSNEEAEHSQRDRGEYAQWNSIQMKDIKETEEDGIENKKICESDKNLGKDFFCLRHPQKKAKYFIQEKKQIKTLDDVIFCCSKCAIDLASHGKKVYDIQEELQNLIEENIAENKINIPPTHNSPIEKICDENVEDPIEIDQNEIAKRDIELSKFIKRLNSLKQESNIAFEQLNSRKKDIIFFYDKQIIKMDQIYNNLQKVIEKEKNQSTAKLKKFMSSTTTAFNSMISQMEGNIKDMNFIYNDIEQNRPNILKHMETDPFNLILSKYDEKLEKYQSYAQNLYIEKLLLEKMTNSSIKIYQKKIDEILTPHIIALFSTFEVSTSYLKKDVSIESESPIPLEKNLPKYNVFNQNAGNNNNNTNKPNVNENNSIYISFENKEMFENAIKNSFANGLKTSNAINIMEMPILSTNITTGAQQINSEITQNSQRNSALVLESSGNGKNSSSTLSNNKEYESITTPKTTDKFVREFNSAQPGKLMNNLNKENPANKNKNKRFQSTDKLQNKKYLTLLEKVNNNQNNTNVFYSNILQSNGAMTSPPIEKSVKHEVKGIFQSLDHKNNLFEFNKNLKFNENNNMRSGNIIQPSPYKGTQNKEIKNYEGFFNFIENKLQDDKEVRPPPNFNNVLSGNNNLSYQKTLFCSSPHFKDV